MAGEKKRKSGGPARVPAPEFIAAWQKAASMPEVAAALEVELSYVRSRSSYLRRNKVQLKKMPGAVQLRWDALNDLAQKLAPEPTE